MMTIINILSFLVSTVTSTSTYTLSLPAFSVPAWLVNVGVAALGLWFVYVLLIFAFIFYVGFRIVKGSK